MNVLSNASTFGFFPLAFMPFPQIPPSLKKVDFSGIFGNAGPNIQDLGNARGKIIYFSDLSRSNCLPYPRVTESFKFVGSKNFKLGDGSTGEAKNVTGTNQGDQK